MNLRHTIIIMLTTLIIGFAMFPVLAQPPIKIGVVHSLTGPFEVLGTQCVAGFKLGLEYATNGTNKIINRDIKLIIEDDQTKPDRGKMLFTKLFSDDKVDLATGPSSSSVALACLPVAKEFKKIIMVDVAASDSIISPPNWNRYIFHATRTVYTDVKAPALAVAKPGVSIATIVQDYAAGRDAGMIYKQIAEEYGAKVVHQEITDWQATDFTAPILRMIEALKDKSGPKYIFVNWSGKGGPYSQLMDAGLDKYGIKMTSHGNTFPLLKLQKPLKGMVGGTYYYYEMPKNPVNDWFVKEYIKRHNEPPDFFHCSGFISAMAVVTGIRKAGGTDTEKLITAMEGMEFMTPKGRMIFRKEDHQALQPMYVYRLDARPDVDWAIPVLVRELTREEMAPPIYIKK
jgi:branched-chain amino acid transport system substrate-binding protein